VGHAGEGSDPGGVGAREGEHVQDDVRAQPAQAVDAVAERGEVAVDVTNGGRQARLVLAAVADSDLVTEAIELSHDEGAHEPGPSEHQHAHGTKDIKLIF